MTSEGSPPAFVVAEPRPFFVAEQPVGRDEDVLFRHTTLGPQLARVADHISHSAGASGTRPSITFLVSGKWGSGKSSALRYIQDRIEETAFDKVVFAKYSAPLYDVKPSNARVTMMYVLLRATEQHARDHPGALPDARESTLMSGLIMRAFGSRVPSVTAEAPTEDEAAALLDSQDQLLLFEALENATRAGVVLEHWAHAYKERRGEHNPTTVVFVDDLDRCSSEFATDVLAATNYWSQLSGHFFVLGAEEERLKTALSEHIDRQVGAPDRGLRKYVHVTVDLSATLPGAAEGKRLFGHFLDQIALEPAVKSELYDQVGQVADKPSGPWALLEPVVNPACAVVPDAYTPRIFKERFNGLAIKLGSASGALSPAELKREVIMLTWPAEWRDRLLPAHIGGAARAWCSQFTAIGAFAIREGREVQAQTVSQRAVDSGLVIEGADPRLAVYLASDPPYSFDSEAIRVAAPTHPGAPPSAEPQPALAREEPLVGSRSDLSELSELLPGAEEIDVGDQSRSFRELSQALSELQLVAELNDESRIRSGLARVTSMLTPAGRLEPGLAPALGNVALRLAPRGMVREAAQLHLLATQANPEHANVSQNFVDFVIDHPFRELFAPADEALDRLETVASMRTWRPLRTRVLRAALAVREGRDPGDLASLVGDVTAPGADVGSSEFANLLLVADRSRVWSLLPAIGGALLARDPDNPRGQAATIRVVADGMAGSSDAEEEEFATELYRFLLESGLVRSVPPTDLGNMLYNYGIVLAGRRLQLRALYLFWEAFSRNPSDDTVRLRLARAYNDNDDHEAAERLIAGPVTADDVPPPPLPPFVEPLPPRSPAAQSWLAEHVEPEYDAPVIPEFFAAAEAGE